MQVSLSPKIEPFRLFYTLPQKQRDSAFFRNQPANGILTQAAVKTSLAPAVSKASLYDRKINALPLTGMALAESAEIALFLMVASTALIAIGIGASFSLPAALEPRLMGHSAWTNTYCINKGNGSMPKYLRYSGETPERAFREPGAEVFPVAFGIFASLFEIAFFLAINPGCFEKMALRRAEADSFSKVDAILSKLSAMVDADNEELLPQDIKEVFPYLTEPQLKLLNFSHLAQAKETWGPLFHEKLTGSLYSKPQLAIWRLFQHLLEADNYLQKTIISDKISQKIIGSDPAFFQVLFVALKPVDVGIQAIFQRILKKNILHPKLANRIGKENFKEIFSRMALGENLTDILASISKDASIQGQQDPFEAFHTHGCLEVHSWIECYNYYLQALQGDNAAVCHWLELYLVKHMDYLASAPSIIEELAGLQANFLFLKIDTHLSQLTPPDFQSEDFKTSYCFAIKLQLQQYTLQLRKHCMTQINSYDFPSTDELKVYMEIQAIYAQLEMLFADHLPTYLQALETRILSLLPAHPKMLGGLANCARSNHDIWLLEILSKAYFSNKILYDIDWLSPFSEQDFHVT